MEDKNNKVFADNLKEISPEEKKARKTVIALITVACVLFVLILVSFFGGKFLESVSKNTGASLSSETTNNVFYALMPKELEGTATIGDNSQPVIYHVQKNENFDYETDEGINFFDFYYYDENGNEIHADDSGFFESGIQESKFEVLFGFTIKTVEKIQNIVKAFKITRIILIILFVIDLIAIWFVEFSISEDRKKQKLNKQKNNSKKKK